MSTSKNIARQFKDRLQALANRHIRFVILLCCLVILGASQLRAANLSIHPTEQGSLQLHLTAEYPGTWVAQQSADLKAWLPIGGIQLTNGMGDLETQPDDRVLFYRAACFPGEPLDAMVWIVPGNFIMGSDRQNENEKPAHSVTISRGFWISRYEVTQSEYTTVMGNNPSTFTNAGPSAPVESVSWFQAVDYCTRLTAQARNRGALPEPYVYRLPTEAEWECACRAGTTGDYSFGAEALARNFAWTGDISDSPHLVGTKKPNPWGIFDMHGNVFEWCLDAMHLYSGVPEVDPFFNGVAQDDFRVFRGGYFASGGEIEGAEPSAPTKSHRISFRGNGSPWVGSPARGFRVVLAHPLN